MEINRHIKKYGSWTDERSEIASGDLKKPYVAYIEEDNVIDWDTQSAAKDYSKEYFTIVVNEPGELDVTEGFSGRKMEYSVNGTNWEAFDAAALNLPITGDFFPCKIHFRGVNVNLNSGRSSTHIWYHTSSQGDLPFNLEGNIMSLFYGNTFTDKQSFPDGCEYGLYQMFAGTGIVSAENLVLPATTLIPDCYEEMFLECTSLLISPVLAAKILNTGCYKMMFQKCYRLKKITCLAEDLSAADAINSWVREISPTGTFVKKAGVTWPTGISGIPNGWTVEEV